MNANTRKFTILLLKVFAGIWCVGFSIFFIASILKFLGTTFPSLENYREWFDNLLSFLFSNWSFSLGFGILFITAFIWGVFDTNKKMGWDELAVRYAIPRGKLKKLNIEFDYGQSYVNDIYYNGIHLSSIPNGLILRHPFPFNYLNSALLIPWDEIRSITIERGLKADGKNRLLDKIGAMLSPWKYANVKLAFFNDIGLVIPWKANTKKNAPTKLVTE